MTFFCDKERVSEEAERQVVDLLCGVGNGIYVLPETTGASYGNVLSLDKGVVETREPLPDPMLKLLRCVAQVVDTNTVGCTVDYLDGCPVPRYMEPVVFAERMFIVALLGECTVEFQSRADPRVKFQCTLKPRESMSIDAEHRYRWTITFERCRVASSSAKLRRHRDSDSIALRFYFLHHQYRESSDHRESMISTAAIVDSLNSRFGTSEGYDYFDDLPSQHDSYVSYVSSLSGNVYRYVTEIIEDHGTSPLAGE